MVLKLIQLGRNKNKGFLPVFKFPNKLFYDYVYSVRIFLTSKGL